MAHRGVGASFKLDSAAAVLTEIATYLDNIGGSSSPDRLDGTTFQPGVAVPLKTEIVGFDTKGFTLTGKWTAAAETFFSAIQALTGLNYAYSPIGTTAGLPKISGLCNNLSYSGPQAQVSGIITFTAEFSVTTRTSGVN